MLSAMRAFRRALNLRGGVIKAHDARLPGSNALERMVDW